MIPGWLQPLGVLVPHTAALRAIRLVLLHGRTLGDPLVAQDLGVLVVNAGAALVGGTFLLRLGLRRAERTGGFSVVG